MGHLLQALLLAAAVLAQAEGGQQCKCHRQKLEKALSYAASRLKGDHWKDSTYGIITEALDPYPMIISITSARFQRTSACYLGSHTAKTSLILDGVLVIHDQGKLWPKNSSSSVSFDVKFNVADSCKVAKDTLAVDLSTGQSSEAPEDPERGDKALDLLKKFIYELLKLELEQYFAE